MEKLQPTRFFLGANTKNGFSSLYDRFTDPAAGDFLWIIKGGPGCGKSTFMKQIGAAAEAVGQRVEYIHCSGDPDSLDAVHLPDRRIAYVDGTAPHVIEPRYPGASELYLDLGSFIDAGALESALPDITELMQSYKADYAAAYTHLSAAAALLPRNYPGLYGASETEKIERKLAGLASRELRGGSGRKEQRRFISAWTCRGRAILEDTLSALCPRLYTVDNEFGLGNEYLARLAALAGSRDNSIIVCPDPLEPNKTECVIFPDRGLGFIAVDRQTGLTLSPYRHLRLDALIQPSLSPETRTALRRRRRESGMLLDAAVGLLASAKAKHDELELLYRPHVDFEGVSALARDHIRWLC